MNELFVAAKWAGIPGRSCGIDIGLREGRVVVLCLNPDALGGFVDIHYRLPCFYRDSDHFAGVERHGRPLEVLKIVCCLL